MGPEIRASTAEYVNDYVETGEGFQETLKALEGEGKKTKKTSSSEAILTEANVNDEVETYSNIQDTNNKINENATLRGGHGEDLAAEDQRNPNDDSMDALLDGDDDEDDDNLADSGEGGEYEEDERCVEDELIDEVTMIEPDTNAEVTNIHTEDDSAAKRPKLAATENPQIDDLKKVTPEMLSVGAELIPVENALFVMDNEENENIRKKKGDEELDKERVVKVARNSSTKGNRHECDKCNATFTQKISLTTHKKSKHEGKRFACDQCDHKATQPNNLTIHKQSKHDGKRFDCDQCDHKATTQGNLKKHKQSKHEGKRFACDQCDYKATQQSNLIKHKQSKHDSKRFDCDQCDYKATQQSNLKIHKQSKHEGKRFACDQCDNEATTWFHLKVHKQSVHDGVTHTCGDCKETFTQKGSLAVHQKAIHEGVMQNCDLCSYSNKHRGALWTHKQDEHGVYSKKVYPMYNMSNVKNRILYELSVNK